MDVDSQSARSGRAQHFVRPIVFLSQFEAPPFCMRRWKWNERGVCSGLIILRASGFSQPRVDSVGRPLRAPMLRRALRCVRSIIRHSNHLLHLHNVLIDIFTNLRNMPDLK